MLSIKIPRLTAIVVGVNVGVWVLLALISFCVDTDTFAAVLGYLFELPAEPMTLAARPWTVLTYSIAQLHPLHLLLNCLVLAWAVNGLARHFKATRVFSVYIMGAVGGASAYVVASWLNGHTYGTLIGASASAMALVAALAVVAPKEGRIVFGPMDIRVENRWICIALIVVDLTLSIAPFNAARFSHLGGAVAGVLLALWFLKDSKRNCANKPLPESVVNKVRQSGLSSLTEQERKMIFKTTESRNRQC